jgi:alkylation response protein AidB-like acyl-CoA dehydrogenase
LELFEEDTTLQDVRLRYRSWLAANVPTGWRECSADPDELFAVQRAWVKALRPGGWAAPHWPVEHGGMGASLAEQVVIQEENTRADAPTPTMFGMAFVHAAATLIQFGTPEQQVQHLPRILEGDEVWCQCFSEPNAGSDLASLSTRAERDGDTYVINGQKIWSSGAHRADWAMLLARTDTTQQRHKGITYFLLDLRSPGVEVRGIRSILDNEEFCEVFLTDVRVPVEDRLGDEGDGWRIAQTTLSTERGLYLLPVVNSLQLQARELVGLLRDVPDDERAHVEQVVASNYAQVAILKELLDSVLVNAAFGESGSEVSILKVFYSELSQRLTTQALDLLGVPGQVAWAPTFDNNSAGFDGSWGRAHYWSWAWTISGGSSEIQRNIIAERVLGLPREPRPEGVVR